MQLITEMTWEEIRASAEAGAVALLPVGSIEQHSLHLPVKTDTALVDSLAKAVAGGLPKDVRVVMAPTLWLGASDHHRPFFALSLNERTYMDVITQLGLSLADAGFRKLFILNGHGGNRASIRLALLELRRQRPDCLAGAAEYWSLAAGSIEKTRTSEPGGAAHGGELETALMMYIAPEAVRTDRVKTSIPHLEKEFVLDLTSSGPVALNLDWRELSRLGGLGDPTQATREKGEVFFKGIVDATIEAVKAFSRLEKDSFLPDA